MSLWNWITPFQIVLIIEAALIVWCFFSSGQAREFALSLIFFGVAAGIYYYSTPLPKSLQAIMALSIFAGVVMLFNAGQYHEREIESLKNAIEETELEQELAVRQDNLQDQYDRGEFRHKHLQLEDLELDRQIQTLLSSIAAGEMAAEAAKLRWGLILESAKTKIHPDDIYNLNRIRAEGQIKIDEEAAKAKAILDATTDFNLAKVQEVLELRNRLKEAIKDRAELIAKEPQTEAEKKSRETILWLCDGTIEYLKGEISEREGNRLVLPSDGQEAV